MNISLTQRCVYHPAREAVARCPGCSRFFCRECVSEHEDVVLCARCLARATRARGRKSSIVGRAARGFLAMFGLLLAWWFFDLLGQGLMKLPASVHEGTVWERMTEE